MPVSRHIQTSLAAGEFDPLLWSREDVSFFYNSARIIENAVPLPQGGAKRREGWKFRALQRGPLNAVSLGGATITYPNGQNVSGGVTTTGVGATITGITNASPAVVTTGAAHGFSTGDAIAIVGVDGLFSRTSNTATITNVTQADPAVVTAVGHGFGSEDKIEITGVGGMTSLNGNIYTLTVVDVDTFTIDEDSSAFSAYTSGGSAERVRDGEINAPFDITVLTPTTFELDGFDSSALTGYISGGTATVGIGTGTGYAIWRVDFGTPTTLSAVDVENFQVLNLPASKSSVAVDLQYFDGAAFVSVASIEVGTAAYNRRYASAPNERLQTADEWRLVIRNPGAEDLSAAVVAWTDISTKIEDAYQDGAAIGSVALRRLTPSITTEFALSFTAGNVDIFRFSDGVHVASVAIPHTDAQISEIKTSPYLDTMIVYHQDQHPYTIQRLENEGDWRADETVFDTIVDFPFEDGTTAGGQNEIQHLQFGNFSPGDKLIFEYNGQISDDIVVTSSASTNASAFQVALNGIPDFSDVEVTIDNGGAENADYLVEWQGVDGKQPWPVLIVDVITGTGTVTVYRKKYGKPDFADLWSADRGYPSCGAFYQGRHYMGGFKSRPDLIIASRAGALFDFKQDQEPIASSPIVVAPNIDDQVTIQNIYPGRHLQIFTSSAELYIPDEPVTVNNIALKVTSRNGSSAEVSPVDIQGGTLFIDREGRALREYLFTDAEQSYTAEPVSLLAGHLVAQPRSLALRRASDVDQPTMLLMANTGTNRSGETVPAALVVIDRAQQVTGFCRISTNGTPLEFATSQAGEALVVVQRDLGGVVWNYIEQFDADSMSDCSVTVAGSGSTIDLSDYPWLEGEEVFVHVDGVPAGRFTVASNSISLGDYSYTSSAEVGLEQVPRIVLHPYKGRGNLSPTMQNQRIFRALLQLERTGALAMTAHDGGRARLVSLSRFETGFLDPTLEELLFSGAKRVSGLGAWQIEPRIEITQLTPMPFLLRSITYDVRY